MKFKEEETNSGRPSTVTTYMTSERVDECKQLNRGQCVTEDRLSLQESVCNMGTFGFCLKEK